MKDSKQVTCEVCECLVEESEWNSHIDTKEHQEKALTQIMEGKLGKDRLAETRTETLEFLEELQHDFDQKQKS